MPLTPPAARVDPDFAHDVLGDLYDYRRKKPLVAWILWATLGWLGAHRFYLERPGTGLLQMFTGGGALVWWIIDAWQIRAMVDRHNTEQELRRAVGDPPLELAFMPRRAVDVLSSPPEWTHRWSERGPFWRGVRLTGDLLVLLVAGTVLGALAGEEGGAEAIFAVVALVGVIMLGGAVDWLNEIPIARALVRWSHRLRLFYYFNPPGPPPLLLVRGAAAIILAPFRRRDRAEVRLYLELGAVFTLAFIAADLVEDVAVPFASAGLGALSPGRLMGVLFEEIFMTFIIIYTFAAPVGAVLTLYLLTRRTHALPRILGAFVLLCIALGAGLL